MCIVDLDIHIVHYNEISRNIFVVRINIIYQRISSIFDSIKIYICYLCFIRFLYNKFYLKINDINKYVCIYSPLLILLVNYTN